MSEVNLSKIENMIYVIRQQKVMMDSDLAELYGVDKKNLIKPYKGIFQGFQETLCFNLILRDERFCGSNLEPQIQLENTTNFGVELLSFHRLHAVSSTRSQSYHLALNFLIL